MTTPLLLQLHGLEVVNLHPHQWEVAIDRVRQALQSLVVDWRLISVVAPRSLASRRQRIHDQLRLLDPSDPRHPRLTAQLLHMQDLEQHAMTSMTHYLVVWCPPSLAHTTVEHTLGRACGGDPLNESAVGLGCADRSPHRVGCGRGDDAGSTLLAGHAG